MVELEIPAPPVSKDEEGPQANSHLLQLAPELRMLVYQAYYHQISKRHFRYAHHCGYSCGVKLDPRCNRCQAKRYINLLLVCRQTYRECNYTWWAILAESWNGSVACNARAMDTIAKGITAHVPELAPLMRLELRFEGQLALRDVLSVLTKNGLVMEWEAQDIIMSHGGGYTAALMTTEDLVPGFVVRYQRWCLSIEGRLTDLDWSLARYEQPVQRWLWNRQIKSQALAELGFERIEREQRRSL